MFVTLRPPLSLLSVGSRRSRQSYLREALPGMDLASQRWQFWSLETFELQIYRLARAFSAGEVYPTLGLCLHPGGRDHKPPPLTYAHEVRNHSSFPSLFVSRSSPPLRTQASQDEVCHQSKFDLVHYTQWMLTVVSPQRALLSRKRQCDHYSFGPAHRRHLHCQAGMGSLCRRSGSGPFCLEGLQQSCVNSP